MLFFHILRKQLLTLGIQTTAGRSPAKFLKKYALSFSQRDPRYLHLIGQRNTVHLKFLCTCRSQAIKQVIDIAFLQIHQVFIALDKAHLHIHANIFTQMPPGVVEFGPVSMSHLKYSFKAGANHHLLIKLGALGKECPLTEEVHCKHLRSAFSGTADYFWSMDLCKTKSFQICPECLLYFLLDPEYGSHPGRSETDGPVIELSFQRSPDPAFVYFKGQHIIVNLPQHPDRISMYLDS